MKAKIIIIVLISIITGIDSLAQNTEIVYNENLDIYRVIAVQNQNEQIVSVSNTIAVDKPLTLYAPNAFSPDGDGVNDTWDIKNTEEFAAVEVIVYNGNGNEIFSSSNYESWDGKYEGKDLEVGSYYFVVKTTDKAGKNSVKTGIVSILR